MQVPDLADVFAARQVLSRYLSPTPLLRSLVLSERFGCDLWVKYENCSPIRSFKARGGIYRLGTLLETFAGVATASTGNHGQGIALGGKTFDRKSVVYVPEGANPTKVEAIRALGADLRIAGNTLTESNHLARAAAEAENLLYVEDGEDPDVMIGCATIGLELLEQAPNMQDLIVPVGGGNLIAACALVMERAAPTVRITGVQSSAAPAVHDALLARDVSVVASCETFAGGLATSFAGPFTFPFLQSGVEHIALVSDDALIAAAIEMVRATGHLPEGAGAAAYAAIASAPERYAGRKVVLVLSGSNAEPIIWSRLTGTSPA